METILITGGTGKLGRLFVEHLFKKNFKIILTTTSQSNYEEIESKYPSDIVIPFVIDLCVDDSIHLLSEFLDDGNFRVNHLVNNARSMNYLSLTDNGYSNRNDFMDEFFLDVVVAHEIAMALAKYKSLKTITNISSQYGIVASNPSLYEPNQNSSINYNVSKSALIHLTKELAVRLSSQKIRVNSISYGGVEGRASKEFISRYEKISPIATLLKDHEVAPPLEFLISEGASAINGHNLIVDNGWTIT